MVIQVDSREKPHAIGKILKAFDDNGIKHFVSKLPVGDYISLDNAKLAIDRKANLLELCGNVCQQHKRFVGEMELANELGIKLIVLCEHGGKIEMLEDVKDWYNPRLKSSPKATTGERLYKILHSMSVRHGVEFLFCKKAETGSKIIELLGNSNDTKRCS